MEPGGALSIRVFARPGASGGTVIVEVVDTGMGIPEHLLSRIFDPFVTTKQRGSGLGLSICRGIADSHRATITAQNNRTGVGATILVEFPVVHDPHQQLAPSSLR
jgi:two-component system sporulation sensor kinase A